VTPGRLDAAVVRRHLLALDEALQVLRRQQGVNERLDDFVAVAEHAARYVATRA
jgi:hypothetical protein